MSYQALELSAKKTGQSAQLKEVYLSTFPTHSMWKCYVISKWHSMHRLLNPLTVVETSVLSRPTVRGNFSHCGSFLQLSQVLCSSSRSQLDRRGSISSANLNLKVSQRWPTNYHSPPLFSLELEPFNLNINTTILGIWTPRWRPIIPWIIPYSQWNTKMLIRLQRQQVPLVTSTLADGVAPDTSPGSILFSTLAIWFWFRTIIFRPQWGGLLRKDDRIQPWIRYGSHRSATDQFCTVYLFICGIRLWPPMRVLSRPASCPQLLNWRKGGTVVVHGPSLDPQSVFLFPSEWKF